MENQRQEKNLARVMLIGAIVLGLLGVWLFGELYSFVLEKMLLLSEEPWQNMIVQAIILVLIGIIGTLILILSLGISNKKMRATIIIFSVPVPVILEVVDLTLRTIEIYNKLLMNPEVLINILQ